MAKFIPEEERKPEDYIREGAATVLRKIRIEAVTSIDDIVTGELRVNLVELFSFDREVTPEREPRTPYREATRYELLSDKGLWFVHKATPIRFTYVPELIDNEGIK